MERTHYAWPATAEYNLLEVRDTPDVTSHLISLQRRITALNDCYIFGASTFEQLKNIYSRRSELPSQEIIRCGAFDHTMFTSIDTYCSQKFPVGVIKQGLLEGWGFEIHGIFPTHFRDIAAYLGYTDVQEIPFIHNKRAKKINYIRPKFFACLNKRNERVFVVAVNSGKDYVMHYASMLKHIIGQLSVRAAERLAVYRYPYAETSIPAWTKPLSPLETWL